MSKKKESIKSYSVAVIPGDGIGQDVVLEGIKVLNAAGYRFNIKFNLSDFHWGSDYYIKEGLMMPKDGLAILKPFDAIYFGAVGHPEIPDHVTLHGLLLPIRRSFDQYVCLRPNVLYKGIQSPLNNPVREIDLVVVRENTEGEYTDVGGNVYDSTSEEISIQTAVFTRRGTERIIRYAFELARKRESKHQVTSVTKSNAIRHSMTFWDRVFLEVAMEYPDITIKSMLVDAASMDLVRSPESFDVIVASNLFGDILSDIAAQVTGSMGLAPSGNINPEKKFPSSFEPVHGSAPDIAGKGIANPMAAILSTAMMCDHIGEIQASTKIRRAVEDILAKGHPLTPDLGGHASTIEVGDEIARLVKLN